MPSDRAVVFVGDVEPDEASRFGGKAVNTSRLHRGGFRVPAGFSISGQYYGDLIAVPEIQSVVNRLEATEDLEELLLHASDLEKLVERYEMPEDLKRNTFKKFAAATPAGRIGRPEDVAEAIVFLIGNTFMTGCVLECDGGLRLVGQSL